MLKSSSAPAPTASSFEGIDNAISCCVTGWMLIITDEQERADVAQVLLWHRVQGTQKEQHRGQEGKTGGEAEAVPVVPSLSV